MTHRSKTLNIAVAVAAIAAAIVVTPLARAQSAPPASLSPADIAGVDEGMVTELARTLRIAPSEALARVGREAGFARAEASLRSTLGATFGGAYLNADATALTVAVTDAAQAARVRRAGAQPVVVSRSEARLVSVTADLDRAAAKAPQQVPGWYPDVRTNSVTVLYHSGALAAAQAWAASSGADTSAIRYEPSGEQPRTFIDVVGGNAYFIGSGTRCSVGFSVNGGFVTAGHCGTTGASTSQPSGSFAGSNFPGNDYAWVRVAAGNTMRPTVNRYPGTVSVAGSQAAGVGASVCRSGSTTGWHCGTITALNSSVTYPQGTVTGLIRTNVCAEPGDSGGSLLAGNQAQGVTSGGSGNCTSGGTTFFQPVNEILQVFGLTLVVSGGTTPPPPTSSPTNQPPPPGCGGLQAWNATTGYTPGNLVSHNGRRYEATWWSTGAEPGAPASWAVWADRGAC